FYPWLRRLALQRLIQLHRLHVQSQKRSVQREEPQAAALPGESAVALVERLIASGTTPSGELVREELYARVQHALAQLSPADRELLVLRALEELSVAEVAAVLGVTEGAVRVRHVRALERLRTLLERAPEAPP